MSTLFDADERYNRDPGFKSIVDMMVAYAIQLQMSPGELREAAVFAEIKVLRLTPPKYFVRPDSDRITATEALRRKTEP